MLIERRRQGISFSLETRMPASKRLVTKWTTTWSFAFICRAIVQITGPSSHRKCASGNCRVEFVTWLAFTFRIGKQIITRDAASFVAWRVRYTFWSASQAFNDEFRRGQDTLNGIDCQRTPCRGWNHFPRKEHCCDCSCSNHGSKRARVASARLSDQITPALWLSPLIFFALLFLFLEKKTGIGLSTISSEGVSPPRSQMSTDPRRPVQNRIIYSKYISCRGAWPGYCLRKPWSESCVSRGKIDVLKYRPRGSAFVASIHFQRATRQLFNSWIIRRLRNRRQTKQSRTGVSGGRDFFQREITRGENGRRNSICNIL